LPQQQRRAARLRRSSGNKQMPDSIQRKSSELSPVNDGKGPKQRDKSWDERLRLVGDANFVDVAWSGKDNPSWPLPKK
jgi:hypothetical protein